jgi:hypothetical protein
MSRQFHSLNLEEPVKGGHGWHLVSIHMYHGHLVDQGEFLALLVYLTWLLHGGPGFETCLVP